ncbi:MAG: hypothetical protein EXR75_13785 [Myxococcales bacterium]|nr:hypothetical protein [Myxococcales bacterium]
MTLSRDPWAGLARLQTRSPWLVLTLGLLSAVLAATVASGLALRTSFTELLPANKESVQVADAVAARLPAISTLAIVAEGGEISALERFVDELGPRLRAIEPELVADVDDGVHASRKFFEARSFLYAPLPLVKELHDEIFDRYDYEVHKRAGSLLDEDDSDELDDVEPRTDAKGGAHDAENGGKHADSSGDAASDAADEKAPPPLTEAVIREWLAQKAKGTLLAEAHARYPNGYYLDAEARRVVVLVRTPLASGDLPRTSRLRAEVDRAIVAVDPKRLDPRMRVGLGGNLITSAETYQQIKSDLAHVGVWGIAMVLAVVFLFYLRVRTVLVMALTVAVGAAWTFGLAFFAVGHLNSSTGFLFSIVVGNGINFGIIYMARYLEERRTSPIEDAVLAAHRGTWLGTLAAAGAAAGAYGSLAVTDFRGFKDFGVIGGSGMLLCWLATYLLLPAFLAAFERVRPITVQGGLDRARGLYGRPFAFLVTRAPRSVAVGGILVTAVALVLAVRFVARDPMEYDMRNIDNDPIVVDSEAQRLRRAIDPIVGRQQLDGLAIAVDRLEQVAPLATALEERRKAAPRPPFERVVTAASLVPTEQDEKLGLVRAVRKRLERAHERGLISGADWQKLDVLIPAGLLVPITLAELPEQVARAFTEKDGTRGRLVYIQPTNGRSVWDGRYLIEWAESFRSVTLPDGSVVKGSGRSVIFADIILAVVEDAPKAILASLCATALIVALAFRARAASLWVIASIVAGFVWTLALLAVWRSTWPWSNPAGFQLLPLKLNFLNFVALPITIGVGADYAVNVMQRYRDSGKDMRLALVETGGAVVLCSLTTMLGYAALGLSVNRAVRSFGIAAAAGEICCLLTGVLVLPAILAWRDERALRRSKERPA